MKHELLELIHMAELHIYENYPLIRSKTIKYSSSDAAAAKPPAPQPVKAPPAKPEIKSIAPEEKNSEVKPEEPGPKDSSFTLAKAALSTAQDLRDIEKMFIEKLPHIKLLQEVKDSPLKAHFKETEIENAAQVLIVYVQESQSGLKFLESVSQAISARFGKTKLVSAGELLNHLEMEKALRLILAVRDALNQSPLLKSRCRTDKKGHYLGNIPLIPMEEPNKYFNNVELKKFLWNSILQALKNT